MLVLAPMAMGGCSESPGTPTDTDPSFELSLVAGGEQQGFVGTKLPRPLSARLTNDGVGAQGRSIEFAVVSGPGSIEPTSATTDADGLASAIVRLGETPGTVSIRISATGLQVDPITTTVAVLEVETRRLATGIGEIGDMALDAKRLRAYVTRPTTNTIDAYSVESGELLLSLPVGAGPVGASMSLDDDELFVALSGGGSVAVVDLTTHQVTPIAVQETTGHATTWDVVEAIPGYLFVSASPRSSGFAWIAKVNRQDPSDAIRVASDQIIRAGPTFEVHPDGTALFVSSGFSPNSLYRLDLTQAAAPIDLEDVHGSVSGVWWTRLDHGGDRLYLGSGQVIDPDTFNQVGMIPAGASVTSVDDAFVFSLGPDGLSTFETATYTEVGSVGFAIAVDNPRIERFPGSDVIVLYSGGDLWMIGLGR